MTVVLYASKCYDQHIIDDAKKLRIIVSAFFWKLGSGTRNCIDLTMFIFLMRGTFLLSIGVRRKGS